MADPPLQRFLGHGADIAGAAGGAAAEFLELVPKGTGGPIGACVASVVKEVGVRILSPREVSRMAGAMDVATYRIRSRLLAGSDPRSDGFFDNRATDRSPGEELLEGVLLKARDSFEEQKVPHLGLFYANLVFTPNVPSAAAHVVLRLLERASYRQLCYLALVGAKSGVDAEHLRSGEHQVPDLVALRREAMDLHSKDLGTMGLLSGEGPWVDKLSPLGQLLYELAGLEEISGQELADLERLIEAARASPVKARKK